MYGSKHHTRRATRTAVPVLTSLAMADLASQLAYSDAVVRAQVETAVRQAAETLPQLDE
jgi:hypothetical protein